MYNLICFHVLSRILFLATFELSVILIFFITSYGLNGFLDEAESVRFYLIASLAL
jgi:ABC-type multidrug transport system permease subunit